MLRRVGMHRAALSRKIFLKVGVLPINDHYYEPLFQEKHLKYPLDKPRNLEGIDLNDDEQLSLLSKFNFSEELNLLHRTDPGTPQRQYFYHNESFGPGDGEFLYSMIRHKKPSRIIEIGSGHSTLISLEAIKKNREENPSYNPEVICIEPFEMPWLSELDVTLKRELVENVDLEFFKQLEDGDVLFIDSSHMIRPQGDVLYEFLHILPILNSGVIVHIHDIFTPRDYPKRWLTENIFLWNEQYLLEAFLSCNSSYKIIGALNYLKTTYPKNVKPCFPVLAEDIEVIEPGSFWIEKV